MECGTGTRERGFHGHSGPLGGRDQRGPSLALPPQSCPTTGGRRQHSNCWGPRRDPCAQAPGGRRDSPAFPDGSTCCFYLDVQVKLRAKAARPPQASECTCGGVFHQHVPHTRGARTRLTPPRAYLHQVLGWRPWHRQVNSAGDAPCPWARRRAARSRTASRVLTAHRPCHPHPASCS